MKKIVSAIVLAVTVTAMPALAKNGLLENSSLGETVIYCDSTAGNDTQIGPATDIPIDQRPRVFHLSAIHKRLLV